MSFDESNDELWDEYKWENHLDEVEKKSDQLRKFISTDQKGTVPRWITLLKESLSEDDAFEAYVEEELLLDEAYFPEDDDDLEEDDEFEEDDYLFGSSEEFIEFDEDDDDFDEGEEWKSLSDDFAKSEYGSLDNLNLFSDARFFAVDTLKWAESVPSEQQSTAFLELVSDSLKIAAKLAGGYSFGFDHEYLGANIAYTKKALNYANKSLDMLQNMKGEPFFNKKQYIEFHSRLFELRNDIGIYTQELRDRFYNI